MYDSTSLGKKKNKDKKAKEAGFVLTKYNKLLKSNDSEAKYTAAVNYFEKKDYQKALLLFEDLLTVYRGTPRAAEVQYYYAFCSYNTKDYIIAGYQFKSFVKNFPDNEHTEFCAYMNASCYYYNSPPYSLDQTDTEAAIKEFQHFMNIYPKSEYVKDCNEKLDILRGKLERKSYENAMLYYNISNYKSAIITFENHLKDFPETKHTEECSFLTLKSYYLLAKNSIETKKYERFKITIDSYVKFAEKFPNSIYQREAEKIYSNALQQLEKYI